MGARTVKLHEFEKAVRLQNCSIRKTTKEWEVIDNTDGKWVCGFATVGGREVKAPYLKNFQKLIQQKRTAQATKRSRKNDGE